MSRQRDAELDRLWSARESARQRQQAAWEAQQAAWERRSLTRAVMNSQASRLCRPASRMGSLHVHKANQRPAN